MYQGSAVPPANSSGNPFNYYVPIINTVDSYIDYYQVQAYNNWYDGLPGGSLEYLQDVYLNWRNFKSLGPWNVIIPGFAGVAGEKLIMGILASTSAGGAAYYATPDTISKFQAWLTVNKYTLKGFMTWDSYWDTKNGNAISKAVTKR